MNTCLKFEKKILDFIENQLTEQEFLKFNEHLRHCPHCQREYASVKRLYKIFAKDEVILPEPDFFDNLKIKIRQKILLPRGLPIWRIIKVFLPIFATAAILLILLRPTNNVEITVSVSNLLEDSEFANIVLGGVIDDRLIDDLLIIEDYFSQNLNEIVSELSDNQQDKFIEKLCRKYGVNS